MFIIVLLFISESFSWLKAPELTSASFLSTDSGIIIVDFCHTQLIFPRDLDFQVTTVILNFDGFVLAMKIKLYVHFTYSTAIHKNNAIYTCIVFLYLLTSTV